MKALHSATSPNELQFASWRIEPLTEEAPQLTFENFPSLDIMDDSDYGNGLIKNPTSFSSPNLLHGDLHQSSPLTDASARINTPTRIPKRQNSVTPRAASLNHDLLSPTIAAGTSTPRTAESPSEGDTSPWCGAVGRASLGKSGRVIERLMADIDKLKRELKAEISHRQEIEKRDELSRSMLDGLRGENANLQQAKETDAAVLKRRDRRIEDLRTDLEIEKEKRVKAEDAAKQASFHRDEVIATSNRELSEAREVAKHATSHAEVLEQSHKQLGTEYRQRTETFANDLQRLTDDRDDERRKVKRLDVVVESLKQEVDRSTKLNSQLSETFAAYKDGTNGKIEEMEETARKHHAAEAALRKEAERVVGEARWLINITKSAPANKEYLAQAQTASK